MIVVTLSAIACGWWSRRKCCLERANVHERKEMQCMIYGGIVVMDGWTAEDDPERYERELASPERVAACERAKFHGQQMEAYRLAIWQPWKRLWIDDSHAPGEDAR